MKLQRIQTRRNKGNFSKILHIFLVAVVPLVVYILIRIDEGFFGLPFAILFVLLSKWRMFSIKARHWPASIRANAVDIIVGVSLTLLMSLNTSQLVQILIAVTFLVWLLFVKPKSSAVWVGIQAMFAQTVGLFALFQYWEKSSIFVLVLLVWGLTYLCARHFLVAYDESMARATAYSWAFFCSSITWVCSHWLIYYGPVAQPMILISAFGYGLASIYYLQHKDKLTDNVKWQFIGVMSLITLIILLTTDWREKIV